MTLWITLFQVVHFMSLMFRKHAERDDTNGQVADADL